MSDQADSDDWVEVQSAAALAFQAGDFERALLLYDKFIARRRDNAEAHYKRANALSALGLCEEAVLAYDRAIALDPNHGHAFCNRGSVFERLHRIDEALLSYDRAIAINPEDYLTHYNRANALRQIGRLHEALISYDRAILIKADYAEAFVNRGNVLQELWRHEAAIASYDKAIDLKPIFAAAFQGRGTSLYQLKRLGAAIVSFDKALALNPGQKFIYGMRRHTQMQICDWRDINEDLERLTSGVKEGLPVSPPHPVLAQTDSPYIQRLAAEIWVREECRGGGILEPFAIQRRKKVSIGYFSPDFRNHPVSQLSVELFERHDRSRFDITAFAFGPESNDEMRTRLEGAFDRFIDVRERSDIEVASLARRLGIDIAVDLGGYTEHCRTNVFALKAAPIQINFLGYPGTMGADFMDYLIADCTVVPPAQQSHYSEKIIYLPLCYLPGGASAPATHSRIATRYQLGLPEKNFVFCCFNSAYKITPDTFDCWMRILRRVKGSVLWLAQNDPNAADNLRCEASKREVDPERLIFANRTDTLAEHLARLACADLVLDTSPYNAHASALDALRSGVPLITRLGEAFAARVAASLLTALGLPELIAVTHEQYEELGVELATNPNLMMGLRQKLARYQKTSPLFDTRIYVANLEAAYINIHERHLRGLSPGHIWL